MDLLLQCILSAAVIMDFRNGRIRNWLTGSGIVAGALIRIAAGQTSLAALLTAVCLPVLSCWLLFRMHVLGAGDIKLFCVIGSFSAVRELLVCMFFSFAAGAVISFIRLLIGRNLISSVLSFCNYIHQIYITGTVEKYPLCSDRKHQIHFSAAVMTGFLIMKGVEYGEYIRYII